jgi:endonuclease YncB( thermonuclease family)
MVIGWASPGRTEPLTGPVRVIDGDTIEAGGEIVRILNIDAPETRLCTADLVRSCARCPEEAALGARARNRLRELLDGARLTLDRCDGRRCTDPYGRTLARLTANGRDVGEILITEGLATRWPKRFDGCGRQG